VQPKEKHIMATENVLAALKDAGAALNDAHRNARALIALLEKMEFSDAIATSSEYELVYAVELLLTQLRDSSLSAADRCAAAAGAAA
jgi:hypothetical protein